MWVQNGLRKFLALTSYLGVEFHYWHFINDVYMNDVIFFIPIHWSTSKPRGFRVLRNFFTLATLWIMLTTSFGLSRMPFEYLLEQWPYIITTWNQRGTMSLYFLILIIILFAHKSLQWSPEDCDSGDLSHFSPPGPVTALFSRPGSGATWVRHLLELATGYETGSVYRDSQALLNGFSGEGIKDGSVLVVKDHFWENS